MLSIAVPIASALLLAAPSTGMEDADPPLDGLRRGFAVHVGASDGRREIALARSGQLLVQGLTDAGAARDAAAAAIRAAAPFPTPPQLVREAPPNKWYGADYPVHVSVVRAPSLARLPYADALADVVVCDADRLGAAAPTDAELLRIVAPRGTLLVRRGGSWRRRDVPVPAGNDEWTHPRKDASGNAVSRDRAVGVPTNVRWLAEAGNCPRNNVLHDGRYVLVHNHFHFQTRFMASVLNAANGLLLWRRELPGERVLGAAAGRKARDGAAGAAGPQDATALPTTNTRNRPFIIAEASRLFTAGMAYRLDDGAEAFPLPGEPVAVADGALIVAAAGGLHALGAADGRPRWSAPIAAPDAIAIAGGRVFLVVGPWPGLAGGDATIAALDLASGRELWRARHAIPARAEIAPAFDPRLGPAGATHVVGALATPEHYLVELARGRHLLFSAADGRLIRAIDVRPPGLGGGTGNALVVGDRLWYLSRIIAVDGKPLNDVTRTRIEAAARELAQPKPQKAKWPPGFGFSQTAPYGMIALDLRGGALVADRELPTFVGRCQEIHATERHLLGAGGVCFPFDGGGHGMMPVARTPCGINEIVGDGLHFNAEITCICLPMTKATMALETRPPERLARLDAPAGVEAGPAFARAEVATAPGWLATHGDGAHRRHSEVEPAPVPTLRWTLPAGSIDRDPVIAGGAVVTAIRDGHRLVCYDAATGRRRWEHSLGGRVDRSPTLHDGRAYVGCRDGWVSCVDLADGALCWRALAAPEDRRIVVRGQVESAWPAMAEVAVVADLVVAAAGLNTMTAEGGVVVTAFDRRSGKRRWRATVPTPPLDPLLTGGSDHGNQGWKPAPLPFGPLFGRIAWNDSRVQVDHFASFDLASGAVGPVFDPAGLSERDLAYLYKNNGGSKSTRWRVPPAPARDGNATLRLEIASGDAATSVLVSPEGAASPREAAATRAKLNGPVLAAASSPRRWWVAGRTATVLSAVSRRLPAPRSWALWGPSAPGADLLAGERLAVLPDRFDAGGGAVPARRVETGANGAIDLAACFPDARAESLPGRRIAYLFAPIELPSGGLLRFRLTAVSGAGLFIDGRLVHDTLLQGVMSPKATPRTVNVNLAAGAHVLCVAAHSGPDAWSLRLDPEFELFDAPPTSADGSPGMIQAIPKAEGKPTSLPAPVAARRDGLALADGCIYVTGEDGSLAAFGAP